MAGNACKFAPLRFSCHLAWLISESVYVNHVPGGTVGNGSVALISLFYAFLFVYFF